MPATNYLQEALLNQVFGDTAYSTPATLYVALSTTTPAENGTGFTEPSGNGYARVPVTNNTTSFPNATGGTGGSTKNNGAAITFTQSTGTGWGTVTYLGIFDALTGGNLLAYGALSQSYTIGGATTFSLPQTTGLTLTLN